MDPKNIGQDLSKLFNNNMFLIVLIISLIILFAICYRYFIKNEGFVNFYIRENEFTNKQNDVFWNKLNKEVMYNAELQPEMERNFQDAVKSIDPMTNKTMENNLKAFFTKDIFPGIGAQDLQCSVFNKPSLLPPHSENKPSGCGWWYIEDPAKISFAAKGTSLGPISDLSSKDPSGRWVWDLAEAQKLEDIKQCRKIKSCDVADLFPNECGFCPILNTGVPINNSGTSKYPDTPNLVCPERIILNPTNCPAPKVTLSVLPNGEVKQTSSQATNICNPVNGRLSIDCLIHLASAVGFSRDGAIINILTGDSEGYYKGKGHTNFVFKKAIGILKDDAKIATEKAFLGDDICSKAEALKYYKAVYSCIGSGQTTRAKEVAGFLALGTQFDPCAYDTNQKGPFELFCLQDLARNKGCQPDGTDYPSIFGQDLQIPPFCKKYGKASNDGKSRLYTKEECDKLGGVYDNSQKCYRRGGGSFSKDCSNLNSAKKTENTKSKYDIMKWGEVQKYFTNLHSSMQSGNQTVLEDATLRCLGIKIGAKQPECSDKMGCEILWYSWDNERDFPNRIISDQTFYGREVKSTLPSFNTAGPDYNPYKITNRMSFKLRTYIVSDTIDATKMLLTGDKGIMLKVNDIVVKDSWQTHSPLAIETPPFLLDSTEPTKIDLYWYKESGNSAFSGKLFRKKGNYENIMSDELMMKQPKTYPLSRWDLYNGVFIDRNLVLSSNIMEGKFTKLDGKKCVTFSDSGGIAIKNRVRGGAVLTYSFMINYSGSNVRLFCLRQGGCNSGVMWDGYSIEGGISSDSSIWFAMQRPGGKLDLWEQTYPKIMPKNLWVSLAFCIDDDFRGVTIYVAGKKIARSRDEKLNGDDYKERIYNQLNIGHINWDCNPPIKSPLIKSMDMNASFKKENCYQVTGIQTGGTFVGEAETPDKCFEIAKSNKSPWFGLHDNGKCFIGKTPDWTDFDSLSMNACGKLGKGDNTLVFTVKYPVEEYVSDSSLNISLAWVHFFDYTLNEDDILTEIKLGFSDQNIFSEDNSSGWVSGSINGVSKEEVFGVNVLSAQYYAKFLAAS